MQPVLHLGDAHRVRNTRAPRLDIHLAWWAWSAIILPECPDREGHLIERFRLDVHGMPDTVTAGERDGAGADGHEGGYHTRRTQGEPGTLAPMAVLQFPRNSPRPSSPLGVVGRAVEIGGSNHMQDIIERVKIDLDEDEIRRLIEAVDHYEAYLHSQQRDEAQFRELLMRLRKLLGKRS